MALHLLKRREEVLQLAAAGPVNTKPAAASRHKAILLTQPRAATA
jgi:hypothetical protein